MKKIDFVITWVDNLDLEWKKQKSVYSNVVTNDDINAEYRYRDMELLKYWFRGIEKFAPWVNKVHFITCGHVPEWLNLECEKLNHVKHADYMSKEWLPTFCSNSIELNMHQITGLQEKFVYFNDDMFLTADVEEDTFFKKDLPCDYYNAVPITGKYDKDSILHNLLNNVGIVNKYCHGRSSKLKHLSKKINLRYGFKINLQNSFSFLWGHNTGFHNHHMPMAYVKGDFEYVWSREERNLNETCVQKFRSSNNLTHWLFRYMRLVEGRFYPKNILKCCKYYKMSDDENIEDTCKDIMTMKHKMICLNDSSKVDSFEEKKKLLQEAFETILPEKSRFEK